MYCCMKRFAFILSILLFISCSKDDNDNSRTTDPIIGTWYDSAEGYRITFFANGRGSSEGDYCDLAFWRAEEENPDFTQVRRYYEWTYVCDNGDEYDGEYTEPDNEVIFSDDFNRMTVNDFSGVRQ